MRLETTIRIFSLLLVTALATSPLSASDDANPEWVIETTEGLIVIELFAEQAPQSVANIVRYVEDGFYDGTIFHRVIDGFMIQGGGYTEDMTKKAVGAPVENEADNGLGNDRGTVALARTSDPHSATAQFYVNTVDNDSLDHRAKTPGEWGYAVFGRVIAGMEVVDRISRTETRTMGGFRDVPVSPIVIERSYIREPVSDDG